MVFLTFFTSLESLASQTGHEASAKAWRGHVFFTDHLAVYFKVGRGFFARILVDNQ